MLLGISYYYDKQYNKAIEALNKALQLNSDLPENYYYIAQAYSLKKDKNNALKYLEQAIDKGFIYLDHIEKEDDLDFIRNTPEYKRIIEKLKDKLNR